MFKKNVKTIFNIFLYIYTYICTLLTKRREQERYAAQMA